MFQSIRNRLGFGDSSPIAQAIVQEDEPPKEVDLRVLPRDPKAPHGFVSPGGKINIGSVSAWLSSFSGQQYSHRELRQAATLPMVQSIIQTIGRDVTAHTLRAQPVPALIGDEWALEIARGFERVAGLPFVGLTYRTLIQSIIEDMLVIGLSYIELLRDQLGQASPYAVSRLVLQYQKNEIDADTFIEAVQLGLKETGPVTGLMRYSPSVIKERRKSNGTFYAKAFLDLSPWVDIRNSDQSAQDTDDQPGARSWSAQDMVSLRYSTGTTYTFGCPRTPTVDMYPLIDVLYTVLYRVREQVEGRLRDKILSFEQTRGTQTSVFLGEPQLNELVESVRRDIAAGDLPVLGGVTATVSDLGGASMMRENMSLLDQMVAILQIGYGVGLTEMGRLTETAEGLRELQKTSRHQQVGNMLRLIKDELFARVLLDPWSVYANVLRLGYMSDLYALDVSQRIMLLHDLTKRGMPLGLLLDQELPQLAETLRALGIDPYGLKDPSVEAAEVASAAKTAEVEAKEEPSA